MTASSETVLPEPDSPTTPSNLAFGHVEGNAVDGAHDALLGAEADAEIADLEHQARPHARIEQDVDDVDQRHWP